MGERWAGITSQLLDESLPDGHVGDHCAWDGSVALAAAFRLAGREVRPRPEARDSAAPLADGRDPGDTVVKPVCRSTSNHNPAVRQFLFASPELHRKPPHIWGVNNLPAPEKPAE
jgi:hypothetical protein